MAFQPAGTKEMQHQANGAPGTGPTVCNGIEIVFGVPGPNGMENFRGAPE